MAARSYSNNNKTANKGNKQKIPSIVKYPNFQLDSLQIGDIDWKNERSVAQGISFINYITANSRDQFYMTTPPTLLIDRGIPNLDDKYYQDDSKREFISIPFDPSNPESMRLLQIFTDIDNKMLALKDKLLGALAPKYIYSPLVKDPNSADDLELGGEPKKIRPKYFKGKLAIDYNTKEMETSFWAPDENGVPTLQQVATVTDATKVVVFMSKIQYVITFNKLWAEKREKAKGQMRSYGLAVKIIQVDVLEKPVKAGSGTKELLRTQRAFDDDVPVSADKPSVPEVVSAASVVSVTKDTEEDEEDEEEDEDEDGEDDDSSNIIPETKAEPVQVVPVVPVVREPEPEPVPVVPVVPVKSTKVVKTAVKAKTPKN
jgi:hypothetical protein